VERVAGRVLDPAAAERIVVSLGPMAGSMALRRLASRVGGAFLSRRRAETAFAVPLRPWPRWALSMKARRVLASATLCTGRGAAPKALPSWRPGNARRSCDAPFAAPATRAGTRGRPALRRLPFLLG
jgi:hypothetical protein